MDNLHNIDGPAIEELASILASRNVDYETGHNISLRVIYATRTMVDWLKAHPEATVAEICQKSRELHKSTLLTDEYERPDTSNRDKLLRQLGVEEEV